MTKSILSSAKGVSFKALMDGLTFRDFLYAFGTLWLEDDDGELSYRPWEPWAGQEGRPGQGEVAWMLPQVQFFYAPKARQKGMTELWSLYCAYVLMKEPKAVAKAFGASADQTKEIMELRFKRKVDGLMAVYPEIPWPRWDIGKDRAECDNGSYFQVYSSENTGAHGGSQRLTLFDEAQNYAKNDFREMMKGLSPLVRGRNQLAVLGTARSGSDFNDTVKGIMGRHPLLRPDVWMSEARTPDNRYARTGMIFLADDLDPTHRVPGWREYELQERYGGDVVDFSSQHPLTIKEMFLNKAGKVVSSWEDSRHIANIPVIWQPHHEFYLVYDHGATEGHPAVALFMQYDPYLDFVYVFDEVFIRGRELAYVALQVKTKLDNWRLEWPDGGPRVHAFGDVRGRYGFRQVDGILLEETGISFLGVNKQDEAARIELIKIRHFRGQGPAGSTVGGIATYAADRKGGIVYSERCAGSIKQISNLRYKDGKDTPQDLENDAFDAEGYGLYEISKREPTKEPTYMDKHHERVRRWKAEVSASSRGNGESAELDPLAACLKAG